MLLLLLALFACDTPVTPAPAGEGAHVERAPPERDLPFHGEGAWKLDGHALTLRDGTLYVDGAAVLTHVYDSPVAGPDALWVPADPGEGDGGIYRVFVADGIVVVEPRLTAGRPERLALSPDGASLVFVSGRSGFASLWALETVGGDPRQLTNLDVPRQPARGAPPPGFVAPPRAPVRFDGDLVRWEADGGPREVRWR